MSHRGHILSLPLAPTVDRRPVVDDDREFLFELFCGANSYDVFRSDTPGGPYALLGSTANNVYVDSPVVPGNTYYYVVQGVFGGENSADSNEAEVVVPAGRRR